MDENGEGTRNDSLGICTKLYNFITRTLTSHALKTVTLGNASPVGFQAVHPMCQDEGQSVEVSVEVTEGEKQPEESARRSGGGVASEKKGPKKMVSINDRVEEIKKGNKALVMLELDEVKPLKSILKVGSNLNAGVIRV